MIGKKKVLAIIPARGQSKRLPRKNVRDFCGKPLIYWTISSAKKSQYIDAINVSTDDPEIEAIAKEYGINMPFMRPKYLSLDNSKTIDLVNYTLKKLKKKYDIILLLQPTSPLRTTIQIDESLELFQTKKAFNVVSVCETDHPEEWVNIIPKNLSMENFSNLSKQSTISQKLPTRYRLNGAIYILKTAEVIGAKSLILNKKSYAYIMNKNCSVDIDNMYDFELAKYFFQQSNLGIF